MKILVINCGSSSLKFQLIEQGKTQLILANGFIDAINLPTCKFTFNSKTKNINIALKIKNHKEAIKLGLETLLNSEVINTYTDIGKVGHRVVHGGEKYTKPTKIDTKVLKDIKALSHLAPLHNPPNIEGIEECKKILPKVKHIAVFDTGFHSTMSEKAFLYALPYKFYTKQKIRRYGFHGESHKYVIGKALKKIKKKNTKIISCHLGNGSSITAYQNKVIDTSMGMTPMEGIMMGTRSGSIDPGILIYLQTYLKYTPKKINYLLNYESGLKGVSKISSDMRNIFKASKEGKEKAILTIEMLAYQLAKQIGAYIAALNGVDAIIFTGGIGENAFYVREKALKHFEYLGFKIDKKKNKNCDEEIHDKNSKVKVFVIPTNESLQIAQDIINI